MKKFAERLRELRQRDNLTQQELAQKIGVSKSSINMYERGEREPGFETMEAIADIFNVDMNSLYGKDVGYILSISNITPIGTIRLPVLGNVACGEPIFAEEDFEGYIEVGSNIKADFCLRAKGDSMINARIFDGDIVFVRQQPDVDNGEIAVVLIEDDATLKRVYKYKNRIELRPENPTYPVLEYENDELDQIRILGKAVAFQSDVR